MKKIRSFTLQKKIIISNILLLLCTTIVLGIYFSASYSQMLYNNTLDTLNKTASQIESALNLNIDMLDNSLYSCFHTNTIQQWSTGTMDLKSDNYITINQIRAELSFIFMFDQAYNSGLIASAQLVIDDEPVSMLSTYQDMSKDLYQTVYSAYSQNPRTPFIAVPDRTDSNIYYLKTFTNQQGDKKITFLLLLDRQAFFSSLSELPEGMIAFLTDTQEEILYNSPDEVGTSINTLPENGNFISRRLQKKDYILNIYIPNSWYARWIIPSMFSYLCIALLILIVFIILSFIVSANLTRFLSDINNRLKTFQNGNYETHMPVYREQDLKRISNTFNHMADEIRHLITTVYEEKLLVKDRELKLLQAQMNPHFLVNSLTTISTVALTHQDMPVYEMLSSLTQLLNGNLLGSSLHSSYIPLEKELKYIECYLFLQKIRFADRLTYTQNIPPDLQSYYIPILTIEPLVENAVIHGIEKSTSCANIQISVSSRQGKLLITISDNGTGFDTSILNHLKPDENGHHVSLTNIHQRIVNLFGPAFGIHCESTLGVGTTVTVILPILTECPKEDPIYVSGHDS